MGNCGMKFELGEDGMNEVYREESARSAINNDCNVALKEIDKLHAENRLLKAKVEDLESFKANNGGQAEYWQAIALNEKRMRFQETEKGNFSLLMMMMAWIATFLMFGLVAGM